MMNFKTLSPYKFLNTTPLRFQIGSIHLSQILGLAATLIYYIDFSRTLIAWRSYFISVPMYHKTMKSKYYFDSYKRVVMDQTTYGSISNTYTLHMDWSYLLIFMIFTFCVFYLYRYYTTRRGKGSMLYVRLYGLFILILTFLFYYDSFFANLIKDFDSYQISMGYPSFDTQVPFYKNFVDSDFLQHFRTWMGYGRVYRIPDAFKLFNFTYDIPKLDKENLQGFKDLPKELYAERIRNILNAEIFPDFREVLRCKNDAAYYNNKYRLEALYELEFMPKEAQKLLSPYILGEYTFGLSLAAIVFIIAIILSTLYLLNFFTSTNNNSGMPDSQKLSPYECGFEPIHTNARIKFDVLYWIIGILYLIFDLEIIFIFPLATILQTLQNPIALQTYLFFMIILTLGFIYEWKKGAQKLNLS